MLTPGIASAYQRGEAALAANGAVTTLQRGSGSAGCQGAAALYRTSGSAFQVDHSLRDEVFGPASLVVACRDLDELLAVLEGLEGQLTATLQLQADDEGDLGLCAPPAAPCWSARSAASWPMASRPASRCPPPWSTAALPATSDGRSTSVGTAAIQRFLRPVSLPEPAASAVARRAARPQHARRLAPS